MFYDCTKRMLRANGWIGFLSNGYNKKNGKALSEKFLKIIFEKNYRKYIVLLVNISIQDYDEIL